MEVKYSILPALVFLAASIASATTVNLSAEKSTVEPGEQISFRLEITPTGSVGGQFVVYRREGGRLVITRKLFSRPSPGQCLPCAGSVPISGDFRGDFIWKTEVGGEYLAEANFGGARAQVAFNVTGGSDSGTTSSSSSTTSSSTTLLPVTSTTPPETPTTTPTTIPQTTSTTTSTSSTTTTTAPATTSYSRSPDALRVEDTSSLQSRGESVRVLVVLVAIAVLAVFLLRKYF